LKQEEKKFRFYFSKACLCRFYSDSYHVADPELPPVVSNEKAGVASSNSIQKSAAASTRAEHVLTGHAENDPPKNHPLPAIIA